MHATRSMSRAWRGSQFGLWMQHPSNVSGGGRRKQREQGTGGLRRGGAGRARTVLRTAQIAEVGATLDQEKEAGEESRMTCQFCSECKWHAKLSGFA